ncbi:uncharacterized protein ColSpa_09163 [Colletotrichum spaethianum]|uniref:Uncharacterized protein n=1 Tax=Colletotrichum spaethianum TaxID=700344 RepID=A0AA37PB52_9PEZI|nr:uncharacterized protein ColSpa_09163 [Colletotrichum spaethianum]GKT48982.1 hypothetical protein ColSpa_09163 [Colletotrichum spaethianum]
MFQVTSRAKRDALQRAMANCMRPGYEAAMKHSGKGIMAKQTNAVRRHADAIGFEMFEEVRDNLEKELADDIKKVSSDIASLWTDKKGCGTSIKAEMSRLVKPLHPEEANQKTLARISSETKNQLSNAISVWRAEWHNVSIRLPAATEPLEEFEEVEPKKMVKMEHVSSEVKIETTE